MAILRLAISTKKSMIFSYILVEREQMPVERATISSRQELIEYLLECQSIIDRGGLSLSGASLDQVFKATLSSDIQENWTELMREGRDDSRLGLIQGLLQLLNGVNYDDLNGGYPGKGLV